MTRKSIIKRSADVLEKLGVGGLLLGIFKGEAKGLVIGAVFIALSFILTVIESKI